MNCLALSGYCRALLVRKIRFWLPAGGLLEPVARRRMTAATLCGVGRSHMQPRALSSAAKTPSTDAVASPTGGDNRKDNKSCHHHLKHASQILNVPRLHLEAGMCLGFGESNR